MRTATVVSALAGSAVGLAVNGVRLGWAAFIALRLTFVGWRTISGRWIVTGT